MKTYITEIGAVLSLIGGVMKGVSAICPIIEWQPWFDFIGEILFQVGIGSTSLRAVSKVIPKQLIQSEVNNGKRINLESGQS